IDKAIATAREAAQNIRDLVFCLRTLSRVTALTDWWARPMPNAVKLTTLIDRFLHEPDAAEFAAMHTVGESLPDRTESPVPSWVTHANTLQTLARAFQWPVADFAALNPAITDAEKSLDPGTRVCVPDRQWTPVLAAYFSSLVVCTAAFSRED